MSNILEMPINKLKEHIEECQRLLANKKVTQQKENRKKIQEYAISLGTTVEEAFNLSIRANEKKKKEKRVLYIDDEGKSWGRANSKWSDEEKDRYAKNAQR